MTAGKKVFVIVCLLLVAAAAVFGYLGMRMHQWRSRYDEGRALYREGRYAEAAEVLSGVHGDRPSSDEGREALYVSCLARERAGGGAGALAGWKAILADPGASKYHPAALLAMGRAAIAENRIADAKRYLGSVLKRAPDSLLAGDSCFLLAGIHEREGDAKTAMALTQKVIDDYSGCGSVGRAQKKLGYLYVRLLFSRQISPGTEEYVVRPGDTLDAIAKRFGTTVELLKEMNEGKGRAGSIRPHDRLKVCTDTFSLLIDKSANTLTLKAGERIAKVYPVGTGKEGTTPVGEFAITNKLPEPEWFRPGGGIIPFGDPENLLGTRWMGIDSPGYGIHGTWEPETIGKQSSAGCVRLLNEDVEELFTIVPVGTKVIIIE